MNTKEKWNRLQNHIKDFKSGKPMQRKAYGVKSPVFIKVKNYTPSLEEQSNLEGRGMTELIDDFKNGKRISLMG